MEVTARTFDLTRSILDLTGKEIKAAAIEVVDWISREGIDKKEFQYCVERLKGLAMPNGTGISIREEICASEANLPRIAALQLKISTAMGRSMIFDDSFIYVVTTVSTIAKYHHYGFASQVLGNMIHDEGGHADGVKDRYSVIRTRVMPVLEKLVDSIFLHVVNAGYGGFALPEELDKLCKHTLNSATLAASIMEVQRNTGDVLITTELFPPDLVSWLLVHFHGKIEISVGGHILMEKELGDAKRKLILLIRNTCFGGCDGPSVLGGPRSDSTDRIQVSVFVDGSFKLVLKDRYAFLPTPRVSSRQKLYSLDVLHHGQKPFNKDDQNKLYLAAQEIVKWLLHLPVKPHEYDIGFTHTANRRDVVEDPNSLRAGDLLANVPAIIHKNYGKIKASGFGIYIGPGSSLVNSPVSWNDEDDGEGIHDQADSEGRRSPSNWAKSMHEIIRCFPIAVAILEDFQERCACNTCKRNEEIGSGKSGCIREDGLDILLLLIAHAISDGLGATDVSGLLHSKQIRLAMSELFSDFINENSLLWDTWFGVAALIYLGGDWTPHRNIKPANSTCCAAIQRGSLVIAGHWLDITMPLPRPVFFRATFAQAQLPGVCGDFATVYTEKVWHVKESGIGSKNELQEWTASDNGVSSLGTTIIGATNIPYRILTIIKSESHLRIIDPADGIMAIFRSRYPECKHNINTTVPLNSNERRFINFDSLLGSWSFDSLLGLHIRDPFEAVEDPEEVDGEMQITLPLDPLKFNIAMSLASDGSIVCGDKLCVNCAFEIPGVRYGSWPVICQSQERNKQIATRRK